MCAARRAEDARTLPLRVLEGLRRDRPWTTGERVLVAVSGGVDSVVLLHLLARLRAAHGGRLEVCSVDHGLRPEAAAEVAMVGAQAQALGLPFHPISLKIQPGSDVQSRARDARRAALRAVGADAIATGHQQDDQAETVLLALLRGSGASGLAAMRAVDRPWCRPLLDEPRVVIEAWARAEGLSWAEDPSNPSSLRGALRRLMPAMEALHGGAGRALARSGRLLAREDALLEALTDEAWSRVSRDGGLALEPFRREPEALQLRLLRRLCAGGPAHVRADQLERALPWDATEGASLPLSGGWKLLASDGLLRVKAPAELAPG